MVRALLVAIVAGLLVGLDASGPQSADGASAPLLAYSLSGGGIGLASTSGARQRLTRHGEEPKWSPDGKRIAFLSDRDLPVSHDCLRDEGHAPDCPYAIYVVNADGTGLHRVTATVVHHIAPLSWSPDSGRIAFTAYDEYPDGPTHVYVVNSDGTGTRRLTRNSPSEAMPAWSPAGRIAFVLSETIWTVKTNGAGQRRLVDGSDPVWSPDGRSLAYFYWPLNGTASLRVIDTSGANPRMVAALPSLAFAATWSPDGRRLAYIQNGLNVANSDGTRARRLDRRELLWMGPSWSPHGGLIAYTVDWNHGVWIIGAGGAHRRQLTKTGDTPDWRPRS